MEDPEANGASSLGHDNLHEHKPRENGESMESSATAQEGKHTSTFHQLGILDRFLAIWIFLAMAIGIILGNFVPGTEEALERGKFVGVSVPIAVGLLVMMYPILCKVRFETLHRTFRQKSLWVQIGFSIIVNWIVAPLFMVLIWTGLAGGDGEYCAILVAINSVLQMVLFAPMAILFIRIISDDDISLEYSLVAKSVGAFLGIPLAAAIVTRFGLRGLIGGKWYDKKFLVWISPLSLIGLLFTIIILFASQGRQVVHQIVSVVRVAAPLIVYFAVIFLATLLITRRCGFGYKLSCTQSFTAASNNFELAIAVAIATFGVESDQALAATVGPLVEVPVLLGLVYAVKWYGKRHNW
ncbi:Arsenical-resistance protein Acr3 [Penicillium canariense]|uniref:Arsenical-resistance protein Acr3 n=1 Tax=Penicillium canariense TaxID=189055 RepID=A0A9W9HVN6_9EURO|nr:Arsenical-resistance protein Acr3 [Penicillium canariense]KAJ5157299.1 Arsenical-resistance protein Acr3 [Penicillium canariense]